MPGVVDRAPQVTGAVGGVAVPGQPLAPAVAARHGTLADDTLVIICATGVAGGGRGVGGVGVGGVGVGGVERRCSAAVPTPPGPSHSRRRMLHVMALHVMALHVMALHVMALHVMALHGVGHELLCDRRVGHVSRAVGFGQFWAEVTIALPPNDQCGHLGRAKLRFGALRRLPHPTSSSS